MGRYADRRIGRAGRVSNRHHLDVVIEGDGERALDNHQGAGSGAAAAAAGALVGHQYPVVLDSKTGVAHTFDEVLQGLIADYKKRHR